VDDEDEWEGINSDEDFGKEAISKKVQREKKKKVTPTKSEKRQKKDKRSKSGDSELGGSFALLSDEDEDSKYPPQMPPLSIKLGS